MLFFVFLKYINPPVFHFNCVFISLGMHEKSRQALSKSMAICSKAEKCISEIQQKLNDWEICEDDAAEIIEVLIGQKFIDEQRYANYYARDKFRFNQWGKVKIRYMLSSKGIPNDYIQTALNEIDDSDYSITLFNILQEKNRKTNFKNVFDKKAKLIRYAQSKGFEYESISAELKKIIS